MKIKPVIFLLVMFMVSSIGLAQAQFGRGGCETIEFVDITPERFECMKERLQDAGITVPPGNEGELSGQGFTADFEWDGESDLTITVTDKPFFVGCETIEQELIEFVEECGGTRG